MAVFHVFSRIVSEGRSAFVVLDTAPTGHSMLLMDATGAHHRQMTREFEGHGPSHIVTPLMRLQDAACTKIILVTLPWLTVPPIGFVELSKLVSKTSPAVAAHA